MRIGWLFVAAVACSTPKPAKPLPTVPASKCPNAADHLLSLMTETAKEAPTERLDAMRKVFNDRCQEDGWSPEAQRCFLGLGSLKEVPRCEPTLTDVQIEAFGRAIGSAIEAQPAVEPPPSPPR